MKRLFGKLYFTVAPFLNNSEKIGISTLSGVILSCSFPKIIHLTISSLKRQQCLKRGTPPFLGFFITPAQPFDMTGVFALTFIMLNVLSIVGLGLVVSLRPVQ